jgi:AcrR family transcriptional regulator
MKRCIKEAGMPKRTAAEAAQTRRRIIDAGHKLFSTKGFDATSVLEIAAAAEVTHGALFHHFEGKQALFAVIAEELQEELHERIYEAGMAATSRIESFRMCMRASLMLTQEPRYMRIVFLDGPRVMGAEKWRSLDAAMGLKLIEDGLQFVAEVPEMPNWLLKPTAMMMLGTINEITYALIRGDTDVDAEACLDFLNETMMAWLEGAVTRWKATLPRPPMETIADPS